MKRCRLHIGSECGQQLSVFESWDEHSLSNLLRYQTWDGNGHSICREKDKLLAVASKGCQLL